jgi:hypothetical protein
MESRRRGPPHQPVPLEIWSADLALKVKLDAALWLRLAERSEVETLLRDGCAGAGADAFLIRFFEPLSDELEIVMNYAKEADTELCCRVDHAAALSWITLHRPDLGPANAPAAKRPVRGRSGRASAPGTSVGATKRAAGRER